VEVREAEGEKYVVLPLSTGEARVEPIDRSGNRIMRVTWRCGDVFEFPVDDVRAVVTKLKSLPKGFAYPVNQLEVDGEAEGFFLVSLGTDSFALTEGIGTDPSSYAEASWPFDEFLGMLTQVKRFKPVEE
jgi:hypothetical protein